MPTTPINGLPSPDSSSPNDPPIHFDALNAVLDSRINSRHTTTTARNAAITAPTTGQVSIVNGYPQVYRASQWRGIGATMLTTTAADTAAKSASATIMTVSVPDPSYPYIVVATAQVNVGTLGAGVTVHGAIRVGTTDLNPTTFSKSNPGSGDINGELLFTGAEAVSGTLTGANTVGFHIYKDAGISANGYQITAAGGYNRLTVKVFPA